MDTQPNHVLAVSQLGVAALVAIPPIIARNLSRNLTQYAGWSAAFGISSALLGILLFRITGYPAGPSLSS